MLIAVSLACASSVPPIPPPEVAARVAGTWSGTIDAGGVPLRIVFHLTADGDGWTATMDSPDQAATGIVVDRVVATAEGLSLRVPAVGGRYTGQWTADHELEGTWTQGPASLPLDLSLGEPEQPVRPQDPVAPFPYRSVDVTIPHGSNVLAGTLTVPEGPGPHPAVVLVSGSGPQDRDSAIFGHRPFLVLADALSRSGVAVLRYDDRGVGASTGDFATATTGDFTEDAAAVVGFARSHDAVDETRVGILGHSEGAVVSAAAAAADPMAFVVLLAGPAVPGRQVIEGQVEALAIAQGASPKAAATSRSVQATILDLVLAEASEDRLRDSLVQAGVPEARISAELPVLRSPWYTAFLRVDPASDLRRLSMPVLALIGSADLQVVPAENVPALRDALAGNPDATVAQVEGLNHLLQPAKTGLPAEYATVETTMDPATLTRIVRWIADRTGVTEGP